MEMLILIFALSIIMWYVIDRFKPLWSKKSWGKYVTIAVAALFAFGLSFGFGLDIVFGLGLINSITTQGQILTGFALMSGSSALSEIIEKIKSINIKK